MADPHGLHVLQPNEHNTCIKLYNDWLIVDGNATEIAQCVESEITAASRRHDVKAIRRARPKRLMKTLLDTGSVVCTISSFSVYHIFWFQPRYINGPGVLIPSIEFYRLHGSQTSGRPNDFVSNRELVQRLTPDLRDIISDAIAQSDPGVRNKALDMVIEKITGDVKRERLDDAERRIRTEKNRLEREEHEARRIFDRHVGV